MGSRQEVNHGPYSLWPCLTVSGSAKASETNKVFDSSSKTRWTNWLGRQETVIDSLFHEKHNDDHHDCGIETSDPVSPSIGLGKVRLMIEISRSALWKSWLRESQNDFMCEVTHHFGSQVPKQPWSVGKRGQWSWTSKDCRWIRVKTYMGKQMERWGNRWSKSSTREEGE